jgi:hypothetical protein
LYIWLLVDALFLLDHSPLLKQHLLLIVPPLAIAASANVLWAQDLVKKTPWGWLSLYLLLLPMLSLSEDSRTGKLKAELILERNLAALKGSFPQQERDAIALIEKHTQPHEFVVTDQQMQAFRAGRPVPPWLCDTSFVRIASGYLTDNETISATRKANAKMVFLWTGRLQNLPGFVKWVEGNYDLLQEFGTKKVYLRREAKAEPQSTNEHPSPHPSPLIR